MSSAFTLVFPLHTFYPSLLSADGQEAQEADFSTGQGLPYIILGLPGTGTQSPSLAE